MLITRVLLVVEMNRNATSAYSLGVVAASLGDETVVDTRGCLDAHYHALVLAADDTTTIQPAESGVVRAGGVALNATNLRVITTSVPPDAGDHATCPPDGGYGPNMTWIATRE